MFDTNVNTFYKPNKSIISLVNNSLSSIGGSLDSNRVYLTGSYSSGRGNFRSDIDLLFVSENCKSLKPISKELHDEYSQCFQIAEISSLFIQEVTDSLMRLKPYDIPKITYCLSDEDTHFWLARILMGVKVTPSINQQDVLSSNIGKRFLIHQSNHLFRAGKNIIRDIEGLISMKQWSSAGHRSMEAAIVFLWAILSAKGYVIDRKKWVIWALNHEDIFIIDNKIIEDSVFNIATDNRGFNIQFNAMLSIKDHAKSLIHNNWKYFEDSF